MTSEQTEAAQAKKSVRSILKMGRDFLVSAAVCATLTALTLVLWKAEVLSGFERLAYDNAFKIRRSLNPDVEKAWQEEAKKEIAIVKVDDLSYALLRVKGEKPPRLFFSKMVEKTTGKAKVVAFDYWFPRQEYPDSSMLEVNKNIQTNTKALLEQFGGVQTGSGSDPRGLAGYTDREFLADFGLLSEDVQETLRGHKDERWRSYYGEVKKREAETVDRIRSGEVDLDRSFRELDPAIVQALEGEGGHFSLTVRKLSATVIITLFQQDILLGVKILLAGNVVLARFIDEGGIVRESDAIFRAACTGEGLINANKDHDGAVRSIPLTSLNREGNMNFTLGLRSIIVCEELGPEDLVIEESNRIGDHRLPDDLELRVNFIGDAGTITYIPLYRFLTELIDDGARKESEAEGRKVLGPVEPEEIEGRILLVGDTTRSGQDFVITPGTTKRKSKTTREVELDADWGSLEERAGVEVHANVIFNIMHGTWLRKPSPTATFFLFAFVVLLSFAFYSQRVGFLAGGILLVVFTAVAFVVWYLSFLQAYSVFPIVPVTAVIGVNFVGGVAFQGILQQRKKQAVTSMFGKYVSDNLVQKMVSGDLQIDTEGRMKELSILFSDIRGFTRLSEGLEPAMVSRILHDYFSRMIRTIFQHGGTLDKLMGDAIMAFFGDPEDLPGHPKKAAAAALAMLEALDSWKASSDLPAVKDFAIGIGLNTGVVTVGNLGSDEYFDYTVIGDNVNLGSRLEGLNKAYKTSIILSETTFRQIEDEFECRRLGRVTVVGKSKPVEIYELLGRKGETPPELCDAKARFEEGLALWEKGEFSEAAKIFRETVETFDDGPSRVFLDLSEQYAKDPPEDFQGVFIPKGK